MAIDVDIQVSLRPPGSTSFPLLALDSKSSFQQGMLCVHC